MMTTETYRDSSIQTNIVNSQQPSSTGSKNSKKKSKNHNKKANNNNNNNNNQNLDYQSNINNNRQKFNNTTNTFHNNNNNNNANTNRRGNIHHQYFNGKFNNNLQNYNSNKPRRVGNNQYHAANGYVRHDASFDEQRLNNSNSKHHKDRRSPNSSFNEYNGNSYPSQQMHSSYSLDNLKLYNNGNKSPNKIPNSYSFMASNIDPYAPVNNNITKETNSHRTILEAEENKENLKQQQVESVHAEIEDEAKAEAKETDQVQETSTPAASPQSVDENEENAYFQSTNNTNLETSANTTSTTNFGAENFTTPNDSINVFSTPIGNHTMGSNANGDNLSASSSSMADLTVYENTEIEPSTTTTTTTNAKITLNNEQCSSEIANMIDKDIHGSPSSNESQALVTASEGESSFGFDHQEEKTILTDSAKNVDEETGSFSQQLLDKVAIEHFISNLHEQVAQNLHNTPINAANSEQTESSNVLNMHRQSDDDKYSINDDELTKKLEANLSATSSSSEEEQQQQSEQIHVVETQEILEQEIVDSSIISEEIADLVNKIVQEVLLRAQEAINTMEIDQQERLEQENEKTVDESFDLIEKNELSEEELRLIELEQQREAMNAVAVQSHEAKLEEKQQTSERQEEEEEEKEETIEELIEEVVTEIDNNNELVSYQKSPIKQTNELRVVNDREAVEMNESNAILNSSLSIRKSSKKSPDVDCFSCNVL